MPQRSDGMRQASGKDVMRLFAPALTLSLADFAVASAQTATPDSENGRYSFNPVAVACCGSTPPPVRSRSANAPLAARGSPRLSAVSYIASLKYPTLLNDSPLAGGNKKLLIR